MNQNDKKFLEENKYWIFMIILVAFISKIEYLNLFENVIINGISNIIFGTITIVLIGLFFKETKEWIKTNTQLYRLLINMFLFFGVISSCYHIGMAIGKIIAVI